MNTNRVYIRCYNIIVLPETVNAPQGVGAQGWISGVARELLGDKLRAIRMRR